MVLNRGKLHIQELKFDYSISTQSLMTSLVEFLRILKQEVLRRFYTVQKSFRKFKRVQEGLRRGEKVH